MRHIAICLSAALLLAAGPLQAQNPRPYTGMQARPLKALSSEELADLKEGRGMGLALAGELNGYPGPKHVLELAKELNLTDAQRVRTQELFNAMKAEAVPLGRQLIAAESDLDRQFSGRTVTPESLSTATAAIGATCAPQTSIRWTRSRIRRGSRTESGGRRCPSRSWCGDPTSSTS